MDIHDLNGKKICILGFGAEGHATLAALEQYAPKAQITLVDKKDISETKYPKQTGDGYLRNLDAFEVLIKSPGIPPQPEFDAVKAKITSPTQIFLDSIAGTGATVIGVTGSKGKSTTSTLIAEMLKAAGRDVHLLGNIGEPSIGHIGDAKKGTIFVLEMSSYQLMDLTTSPQIAVVTSFFPEHLDYHGSLEAYKDAKEHIARFQNKRDTIVYNTLSEGAREIALESPGTKIPFSADDCPVAMDEIHLLGEHNLSNIAAAYKVSLLFAVPENVALEVIKNFHGLPHRLQMLGNHHGIDWVDDAISTTPESTIAALDALGDQVVTVILGGQDRGNDFSGLAARIKNSSVKTVILFPGSGPRIREAIGDAHADVCFHEVPSMEKAVEVAKKNTMEGKICLLSTASPSYGMFKNFEEKGDMFKKCILG